MANFKNDLQAGLAGQKAFKQLFAALVETDGRQGDFVAPDGCKIELKTDSYDMQKTANFFIEQYSSLEVLSPGGPWQAQKHDCEYFVYYYGNNSTGFIWRTEALIEQLEAIIGQLKPTEVRNKRWTTLGYKVPRALLKPLASFNKQELHCNDGTIIDWGFTGKSYIAGISFVGGNNKG